MKIKDLMEMPIKGNKDDWDFNKLSDEIQKYTISQLNGIDVIVKKNNKKYAIKKDYSQFLFFELKEGENLNYIGYLTFTHFNTKLVKNPIQVQEIEIHKKYRRQGLATFFYESIHNKYGYSLISDEIQYENSRRIWKSLSQKGCVVILNTENNTVTECYKIHNVDDDSIWCNSCHSIFLALVTKHHYFENLEKYLNPTNEIK